MGLSRTVINEVLVLIFLPLSCLVCFCERTSRANKWRLEQIKCEYYPKQDIIAVRVVSEGRDSK